ncbi:nucleotide-diphospho-sugar transferase [Byssothecium circinans]|uniref:Nucleotide-diphospho-sugar transferase n=1 Tax=Byssothecium circinans TaxID=147558 RepID=A0A6A5TF77_9PLEO|nr:nucleotide-diphospho-sugar transferase [Byssothecium circinans]
MKVMFDRRGITAAIIATLLIILVTVSFHEPTYDAIKHKTGFGPSSSTPSTSNNIAPLNPEGASGFDENGKEKLAYVVLLSGTIDSAQGDDLEKDNYFIATRILIWQLLHVPESRTKHDVIVMVTPSVTQSRVDRLKKDGAIVTLVDFVKTPHDSWIHPGEHQWDDLMTKFRAWQLTQYNRVLLLDGDTQVRRQLDGVFDQPLAQIQKSLTDPAFTPLEGQIRWPDTYLFAGGSEVWDSNHKYPPFHGGGLKGKGHMNAGFILLHPDQKMFDYLTSFMEIKDSFDPQYNEQALLNKAFDWGGPMPWKEVGYTWNIRCPNENDFEQGLPSMHEKWWTQPYIFDNQKVKDWLLAQRWEMKGWYAGKEAKDGA